MNKGTPADPLREALAELVACKEMREEVLRRKQRRECSIARDPDEVRAVAALHEEWRIRDFRAWNVARAALATKPAERPASKDELDAEYERVAQGDPRVLPPVHAAQAQAGAVQRPAGEDRAKRLARMWLGTHYADAHEADEIEALCWEILGSPDEETKAAFRIGVALAPAASENTADARSDKTGQEGA